MEYIIKRKWSGSSLPPSSYFPSASPASRDQWLTPRISALLPDILKDAVNISQKLNARFAITATPWCPMDSANWQRILLKIAAYKELLIIAAQFAKPVSIWSMENAKSQTLSDALRKILGESVSTVPLTTTWMMEFVNRRSRVVWVIPMIVRPSVLTVLTATVLSIISVQKTQFLAAVVKFPMFAKNVTVPSN